MASDTAAARPAQAKGPSGADIAIGLGVLGVLCLALIPVEIHRAFGLPAHPLLLHVPVVLVPILGLTLLLAAIRPAFFERYALAIGALTVVALAGTILAVGAGEAFRSDRMERGGEAQRLSEHADSGETLRLVMIGLAAVVLLAVLVSQSREGSRLGFLSGLAGTPGFRLALRTLVVVGAVAAIFFVIRTGHLGAKLTWERDGGGGPPPGFNGGPPGRLPGG